MDTDRWGQWNEYETGDADIMRFATEIAREAFADGAHFGTTNPRATCGDMLEEVGKRYPFPKPEVKYRTAGPDTNGNRWQVRDGITWIFHNGEFRRHLPVGEVLNALTSLGKYHNVAIVAELAANPTEE